MAYPNGKLSEEKVFKDPVHRYVHVRDKLIWDLIGTREFQRLRRIKQLGTTYLTFHGAEHSRFNHSLGVYEIVRRMVDDVFKGRPEWDDNERELCLSAALLHDLGHGPFSHSFEKVFHLDHEDYTREIILGDTEVNQVLRKAGPGFPQDVAEVIAKTYKNTARRLRAGVHTQHQRSPTFPLVAPAGHLHRQGRPESTRRRCLYC